MGIGTLFRIKNLPLSFPLLAPFPLVCLYSAKNLTNWHLVAMSFILLAIGVVVNSYKKLMSDSAELAGGIVFNVEIGQSGF
jgi:hypothetical protein